MIALFRILLFSFVVERVTSAVRTGPQTYAPQRARAYWAKNRSLVMLAGATAIDSATAMFLAFRMGFEPAWGLLAAAALAAACFVMRKWPVILLVCLLFVGNFKTTAAQGISFTDPTMILLLLTAGAVFLELLFILSRVSEWSLQDIFHGQQFGIISFVAFVSVVAISYLYTAAPHYGGEKVARFLVFKPLVFFAAIVLL